MNMSLRVTDTQITACDIEVCHWVIDRYIYLSNFPVTSAGREDTAGLQVINSDESLNIFFFSPPELSDYSSPS